MKIKLVPDVRHSMILSCYGSTWAEKKSRFPVQVDQNYVTVLEAYNGEWLDVDTTYLFTQSFNVPTGNGLYGVDQRLVDQVDMSPEFSTWEEWLAAVQKRYDTDWPGTDCTREMLFWKERIIKQ